MAETTTADPPAAPETKPTSAPPTPPPGKPAPAAAPPKEGQSFIERMTGRKPPAAKKEAAAPAAPKAAAPAAPKPKPLVPPPEPVNYEALAEAAGRGAAAAIAKSQSQPNQRATQAEIQDELSEKQKRTLEILQRMEKEYPDSAGISKAYTVSLKKALDYQGIWESQHPGETFDPGDSEHDQFFEANDIDWDDDEYMETLAIMRAEVAANKAAEKITPRIAAIDRREHLRQLEPQIVSQQINAARSFWSELGDEYKDVLFNTPGKAGDGQLNMTEIERLRTEDPARELAFQVAQNVEAFASELHMLTLEDSERKPLYPYNPQNEAHRFIANFIQDEEAAMKELPVEQQLDQHGRRFATADEYFAMTPHRQNYYWHFTDADLAHIYAGNQAAVVKAALAQENEKFEKTATARGYTKNGTASTPAQSPPATTTASNRPYGQRTMSPAGTVEPRLAPTQGQGQNGQNSASSSFVNRWLGRA